MAYLKASVRKARGPDGAVKAIIVALTMLSLQRWKVSMTVVLHTRVTRFEGESFNNSVSAACMSASFGMQRR